jgi:hypothetical protein
MAISDTFSKVEVITGVAPRRRFTADQKLASARPGDLACQTAMLTVAAGAWSSDGDD